MMWGSTGAWYADNYCRCTATACCCSNQVTTASTTVVTGNQIVGNQIVFVMVVERPSDPDPVILLPRYWRHDPPPRYQRRPRFRLRPLTLIRKTAVRRARRARGHAIGHSPRRRSRH